MVQARPADGPTTSLILSKIRMRTSTTDLTMLTLQGDYPCPHAAYRPTGFRARSALMDPTGDSPCPRYPGEDLKTALPAVKEVVELDRSTDVVGTTWLKKRCTFAGLPIPIRYRLRHSIMAFPSDPLMLSITTSDSKCFDTQLSFPPGHSSALEIVLIRSLI